MTTERDLRNQMAYARQEAIEEGLAEGRAEGLAKGLAEGLSKGRAEGLAEGRAEGLTEVAKQMLADGMPADKIATYTKLSIEEIKSLQV